MANVETRGHHKYLEGTIQEKRFDILIISGSYGGHRRHTKYDGQRTMPRVWHKLPTGQLKKLIKVS